MDTFKCSACKETKPVQTSGGTGFDTVLNTNEKICYDCCGKQDLQEMKDAKPGECFRLYLDAEKHPYVVSNWAGTLIFNCYCSNNGTNNIAKTRIDVWFDNDEIGHWWGVQYGDQTQICHCTKLKRRRI